MILTVLVINNDDGLDVHGEKNNSIFQFDANKENLKVWVQH